MFYRIFQVILISGFPIIATAQNFTDTIFTYTPDTIICKVDHLDSENVYYRLEEDDKNVDLNIINKVAVASIAKGSERYFDLSRMSQIKDPGEDVEQFTETNGIIHPADLDSPPVFQGGEVDFLRYMQNHVRNQTEHASIFGNSFVNILYEATIDDMGQVKNVQISQSSISTGNTGEETNEIEYEIRDVLSQMPNWTPAVLNDENTTVDIYIPIKFRIEQNSIIMYSGKNAFVFGNMK